MEETMLALHDLVKAGKVRYLGASNIRTWQFIEMNNVAQVNGWTQFACVQVEHSLLYRTEVSSQLLSQLTSLCSRTNASDFAQELELFSYCNYKGIGITGFSPLMDGHLARPIGTETSRSKFASGSPFEKKRRESDLPKLPSLAPAASSQPPFRSWRAAPTSPATLSTNRCWL